MSRLEVIGPDEHFRQSICRAASHLDIELGEEAEYYLVRLLCGFICSEQVDLSEPLAFKLSRALSADSNERINLFKELGDTSLYLAGFFKRSIRRSAVGSSYYIAMGSGAYQKLSVESAQNASSTIYDELAFRFPEFVNVVATVAEDSFIGSIQNLDLLAAYEHWMNTGSENLRRFLESAGITPIQASSKEQ